MKITREFDARLAVEGVTIDRRDVEMLEAIDRYGSMSRAADELGRSYARVQRRIVEIEDALGPITERSRGGSERGGTELTANARRLRRHFDRHRTGLGGVATVTESVLAGTVVDRDGELATVETPAGSVLAVVPDGASDVQLGVRSDAVVLTDPAETPDAAGTSLRNQFAGTVTRIESGEAITRVGLELDGETPLEALVTRDSADVLDLGVGQPIVASFKATAARGIRID